MQDNLAAVGLFVVSGAVALSIPAVRARLSSMRTGVALLAVVAALSMLGVLIGQDLPVESYSARFGPVVGPFVARSGLASVFRSWYFLAAAWALTLSVLSCSLGRILRLARSGRRGRVRAAALGSLVTHLSLAAVVAGGVVTATLGFRRADGRFLAAGHTTEVPEGGFALEVIEASTEFDDSGALKDYVSIVNVIENGESEGPHRIEVNHPLTVNGVSVYQYEMLPSPDSVESVLLGVVLNLPDGASDPVELLVPFGEEKELPDGGLRVKPLEFLSDFTYDIDSSTAGLRSIWHDNPAVLVRVSAADETVFERWLFVGARAHADDEDLPCRLYFLDYEPDFRNGLTRFEYSRQPGTPLVFGGLAALSVGMCVVLWTKMSRREGS